MGRSIQLDVVELCHVIGRSWSLVAKAPAGVVDVVISKQEIGCDVGLEREGHGRRHGQTVVKILTADVSVVTHV